MDKKTELIEQIRQEILGLEKSPLYKYRKENNYYPVIGQGNLSAKIMFVGEAPGKNEALSGKPFCGAAGNVLDELLLSIGLKREDVYITNIVNDRPQENRDPTLEEIKIYSPFLDRQIEIIKPKIIAGLGRFSAAYIMERFGCQKDLKIISQIHGKIFAGKTSYGNIKIIPLYHPAAALYQGSLKETLKKDFKILIEK